MNHFSGITPQERYQNDLLDEIRKMNANMEKLIALMQPKEEPRQRQTRKRKPA